MQRGIPGERGRFKERLEACLSWICELELLKQRQENLVLAALALGDPGTNLQPGELTLRRQLSRLQGVPSVLTLVLQHQLSELRLDTCDQSAEDDLDSPSSSGFYEQSETPSPPRRSNSSPSLSFPSHKSRSVDAYTLDWEGQREPIARAGLPRSFSAPYPALEGIAEGIEEEEDDEDGALWSESQVGGGEINDRPEMGPPVELEEDPLLEVDEDTTAEVDEDFRDGDPTVEVDEDFTVEVNDHRADVDESHLEEVDKGLLEEVDEGPLEELDEGPTAEDYEQAMRVEAYILGLIQRCSFSATANSPSVLRSISNHWQDLHIYQPDTSNYCDPLQDHPEWQDWVTINEGEDQEEGQHEIYYKTHLDAQTGPSTLLYGDQEPCLDMDHYGAMDPSTSSNNADSFHYPVGYLEHQAKSLDSHTSHYIHTHDSSSLTCQSAEQDWMPDSLEQALPLPLSRRHQEEQRPSPWQKQVKMTSRSHSESSFLPQGWSEQPDPRYHTVGRDLSSHRTNDDYPSNQRLWSSYADLSREEEELQYRGEDCVVRNTCPPFHTLPQGQYTVQNQRPRTRMNGRSSQADGSDSSMSETCSPASSSLSSDSDESGGLVWPLQLPPRLPSSSTPGAVVKIKASHALKRKIMRFRSGSLKVMTTV